MSYKYLSVIIDSVLCVDNTLSDVVRKVNRLFNFGKKEGSLSTEERP